jgi:hypothetical protein
MYVHAKKGSSRVMTQVKGFEKENLVAKLTFLLPNPCLYS